MMRDFLPHLYYYLFHNAGFFTSFIHSDNSLSYNTCYLIHTIIYFMRDLLPHSYYHLSYDTGIFTSSILSCASLVRPNLQPPSILACALLNFSLGSFMGKMGECFFIKSSGYV